MDSITNPLLHPADYGNPIDSVIDTLPPPADPDDATLKNLKKRKANAVDVKKYKAKQEILSKI